MTPRCCARRAPTPPPSRRSTALGGAAARVAARATSATRRPPTTSPPRRSPQALLGLGRFRGEHPGNGAAWLWGIARNLLRQHYRTSRLDARRAARLGDLAAQLRHATGWDDVDARATAGRARPRARRGDGRARRPTSAARSSCGCSPTSTSARSPTYLDCNEPAARMRVSRALAACDPDCKDVALMLGLAPTSKRSCSTSAPPPSGSPAPARRRRALRASTLGLGASGSPPRRPSARVLVLGDPAPPDVERDLRDVDTGLPADLRLNPDVEHAHSVAAAGGVDRLLRRARRTAATAPSSSPARPPARRRLLDRRADRQARRSA